GKAYPRGAPRLAGTCNCVTMRYLRPWRPSPTACTRVTIPRRDRQRDRRTRRCGTATRNPVAAIKCGVSPLYLLSRQLTGGLGITRTKSTFSGFGEKRRESARLGRDSGHSTSHKREKRRTEVQGVAGVEMIGVWSGPRLDTHGTGTWRLPTSSWAQVRLIWCT